MAVLKFDPTQVNFIEVEGEGGWFLAVVDDGVAHMLPSRCRHRGGPLHLGTIDPNGDAVLCPWHDNPVRMRWLRNRALPLIRRQGDLWTAIVPDSARTPWAVSRAVIAVQPGPIAVEFDGQPECAIENCNNIKSKRKL